MASKKKAPEVVDVQAPVAETPAAVEAPPAPVVVDPMAPVEVALHPHDAALVQLANERVANAQLHLQNRKTEFETLLTQVRAKYEEGGKFVMTKIDVARGVITRQAR